MSIVPYLLAKFYMMLHLTANIAWSKQAVYLSRFGIDCESCGRQSLPCRTISYAIHQASENSYIYLDGNNTPQDPYICHPVERKHPGIYLNKSISFVGIKSRAHISCLHGNYWFIDGTKHKHGIRVSFNGLAFQSASLRFFDVLVKVNDTLFVDCNDVNLDFAIFNLSYFILTLNNVIFQRNVICMVVKSTASTNVFINLTNSIFTQNGNDDLFATGFSSILSLNGTKNVINIALKKCSFNKNAFNKFGIMIDVDNMQGSTSLLLDQFTIEGNDHSSSTQGYPKSIFRLQSAYIVVTLKFVFIYSTFGTFLTVSGQSALINIANVTADGFYSPSLGGVVHIIGRVKSHVTIKDSRFRNGKSGVSGGAVAIIGQNLFAITIQNCTFHNMSSCGSGGAVYVESQELSGVMNITCSSFSRGSAIQAGAVFMSVRKLFVNITKSVFAGNNRSAIVLLADNTATVSIRNVQFMGNYPDKANGALVVWARMAMRRKSSVTTINTNKVSFVKRRLRTKLPKGNIFSDVSQRKSSMITITNSKFVHNFCAAVLIYADKSSNVKIIHSTFVRNRVIKSGGSIVHISLINNSELERIDLKHFGNFHHNNVLIEHVLFKENVANSGGVFKVYSASMDSENGCIKLVKSTFVNNFARFQGGQVNSLGTIDIKIYNSVFKQTRQKMVENQIEFTACSFLKIKSYGELHLWNTTIDSSTKFEEPLIFATGPNKVAINKSSEITCAKGYALEKTAYNARNGYNDENFLEFSCKACDYNFYSLQRGHANDSDVDNSFKCIPCPRGADCIATITSKPNFWGYCASSNPCILAFTLCPFGYCKTPQENSSKYNDCQGKRTGVMCGSCSNGYSEALWSTHCTPTKDCNDYWFWIPFLVLVLFLAIIFVLKPPFITRLSKYVLWFTRKSENSQDLRYHNVIRFWSLDGESRQDNMPRYPREQPNEDKRQFSRFLEIIFYFYQIARLLLSSYSLNEFFENKILSPVLGLFNFEPRLHKRGSLCPFPGLTPKTKLAFKILPVTGTMIAIFIIYSFHVFISKVCKSRPPSVSSYLQASIKTILLGYTTLATVGISFIRCVFVAGKDRWFYNGNVICYQWWQYVSLAFNGIFVVPLVFVLAWASFKVHHGTITVRQFLLALVFPLPFLLLWLLRVVCQFEAVNVEETENFIAIKETLLGPYKEPGCESKYGAMYWQSVLIARRFILVFIFCTITEPSIKLFCMTLVCVLVLFFHLKVKPFRNALANNFESLSLLLLVVLGLINLLKSVFVGFEEIIKGPLITVFNVFLWLEIVILGLFPALLSLLVCLAIISLIFRVLFICCWSLFNCILRQRSQRRLSQDTGRLVNICEDIND